MINIPTAHKPKSHLQAAAQAVIALSLLGLIVSIYLAIKYYTQAPFEVCPLFESGCDIVNASEYSAFLGIPLALYGVAYYITLIVLSVLYLRKLDARFMALVSYFAFVGVLLSALFVAIQAFLIGAYCFYCEVSATAALLLFLVTLPTLISTIRSPQPRL